jgi:hypothetical protein
MVWYDAKTFATVAPKQVYLPAPDNRRESRELVDDNWHSETKRPTPVPQILLLYNRSDAVTSVKYLIKLHVY